MPAPERFRRLVLEAQRAGRLPSLAAAVFRAGELVWSDNRIGNVHWQSPIVVNGRIYMIDQTSKLWVYVLDGVFRDTFD